MIGLDEALSICINKGLNGIYSMSVGTSCEERLAAYYYASWLGFFCIALMCRFKFWLFGEVFTLMKAWYSDVTYFRWKPPLLTPVTSLANEAPAMPLRTSSHPWSPNCPSCFALAWYNDIIMGRMGICFTSVVTSWWGEACCLLLCFPTGICVLRCT